MLEAKQLQQLIEGALLAANKPLTESHLLELFEAEEKPTLTTLRNVLVAIEQSCVERGFNLVQLASGYQFQVKQEYAKWVARLWEEKPAKYSKAFFETLAIIAYRQPVTKGEIEEIRGVSISTSTFRMMDERNWVRVVGHKNVPGKPALYATTKQFLDYFGLKSLDELPSLPEIMRLGEGKNLELDLIVAVDAEQALSSQVSADLVTISSADNQEMLDTSKLEHDQVVSEGESDSAENENYSNESEHNDYAMVEEIIEAEAITEVE